MASRWVAVWGACLALMAQAGTAAPAPAFMPFGEVADAPHGFADLCTRTTLLCHMGEADTPTPVPAPTPASMPAPATTLPVVATGDARAAWLAAAASRSWWRSPPPPMPLLKRINRQVNRGFGREADRENGKPAERWQPLATSPDRAGDCEDFAIEKRMRLTALGVAPERMFYAVSFVRGQGLHVVLAVRLDDGDVVLDSLSPRIRSWHATHYVWLRFQTPGQPMVWTRPRDRSVDTTLLAAAG